ncbi:MAG TPA: MASE1 domain-containing protein, partial [Cellvibrionaceae bacterium]|nr:MASE1 domain-containing protein [Cellvibrionaceae bacterium]
MTLNSKNVQLPQYLTRFSLVYCAYLVTAWLGLSVPFVSDTVTLFWLPSGISVAALFRWGWKIIPAIFLAAFTINVVKGADIIAGSIIACGNSLGPLVAASLLKQWRCNLLRLKKYTALKLIAAAILGTLISALIGAGTLA